MIRQASGCDNSQNLYSPSDTARALTNFEEIITPTTTSKVEKENPNGSLILALNVAAKHDLPNGNIIFQASTRDSELDVACDTDAKRELLTLSKDIGLPAPPNEESESMKSSDDVLGIAMVGVSMEVDMTNEQNTCLASNDLPLPEHFSKREQFRDADNDAAILADCLQRENNLDDYYR